MNDNYKTLSPFARANYLALDKEACFARNVAYEYPFDISDIKKDDIEEFVCGLNNYSILEEEAEISQDEKAEAFDKGRERMAYCTYSKVWLNIVRQILDKYNIKYSYLPKEVVFHGKHYSIKHRIFFHKRLTTLLWQNDPRSREFFHTQI